MLPQILPTQMIACKIAAFSLFLLSGLAHGGYTVDARLNSVSGFYSFEFYRGYGTASQTSGSVLAVEQYYVKTVHTSPDPDAPFILSNFSSYCVELTQSVSIGQIYSFDVKNVEEVPNPGPPSPMGVLKADMIRELHGLHYGSVNTDAERSAFQIAIWNIVYDGDRSIQNDSEGGTFRAKGTGSTSFVASATGDARQIAEYYLNSLSDLNDTTKAAYFTNLVGLTDPQRQDQITVTTPAPPTWIMALCGVVCLLGFSAIRRRRILA